MDIFDPTFLPLHCIVGAVNIPMFRFVTGTSNWDNLKKIAMASFGMTATGAWKARAHGGQW